MGKCPICFKEIKTADLMYEVWFYKDDRGVMISPEHEWITSTQLRNLFDKNSKLNCIHYMKDYQMDRFYSQSGVPSNRYLMLSRQAWRHMGKRVSYSDYAVFTYCMEKIQNHQEIESAEQESRNIEDDFGDNFFQENAFHDFMDGETFRFDDDQDFGNTFDPNNEFSMEMEAFAIDYNITGKADEENRGYRVYVNNMLAFQLVPCCPHCHARLPKGWLNADCYVPVGFFSPKHGGKTTITESLIANDFEIFNNMNGTKATPAQNAEFAPYYKSVLKRANKLIEEHRYHDGSQPYYRLPIFFNLELEGKKILVGLFDIAGESLETLDPLDPIADFLMNMSGIVCLIDPNSMSVHLKPDIEYVGENPQEKAASGHNHSDNGVILKTIDQQAEEQRNCKEEISVRELLKEESEAENEEMDSSKEKYDGANHELTIKTFRKFCSFVNAKCMVGEQPLKNIHLAMTIMKSDELKETPEIQSKGEGDKIVLFQDADSLEEYIDTDIRKIRQLVIPGLFDEYFFKGNEKRLFTEPFKSVSWHCISAVGCSKTRKVYEKGSKKADVYYVGEYSPIRVVEPVLECVFREMGIFC